MYLRALERSDLDFLFTLENDVSLWCVSNTVAPFSREVLEHYLDQADQDIYAARQLRLVICTPDHQAVGAIDLFDFDPLHLRAGIGIMIREPFRRQGLAGQALKLLLHYGAQYLLLHQLYCSIAADNEASLALFRQADFQPVGTRRHWLRTPQGWADVVEMQKIFLPASL
ncbi:MAG TPA: GNAT family N-acetyltransferase [Niastella sp.]|nr:GNAT family N-acetyltransferase [Niastella sp.]